MHIEITRRTQTPKIDKINRCQGPWECMYSKQKRTSRNVMWIWLCKFNKMACMLSFHVNICELNFNVNHVRKPRIFSNINKYWLAGFSISLICLFDSFQNSMFNVTFVMVHAVVTLYCTQRFPKIIFTWMLNGKDNFVPE